ncbi:MAG TPA: nitrate- and nitrite sensing domain-containing protein [Amycolatopsis sp.]|uniref:sensor histidine kinase n=1 Tax=Amycolatopsis sp. TaxID=37632 RepID=UPI002B463087|nr:nitrate- and nitrite sensing domain-containing protein [Amycolatopsis sp.]HKS48589.1 nitrate- and nitrite sensing domain-containing protein [Amycolatopsis sp.]
MPVGQLLGQQPRRPSKWRSIIRWRDWRISVKLAAVTLVPIVFALVLGGITIGNQVQLSQSFERVNRLVTLGSDVRTLLTALEQERTETAALLTRGTVGSSAALDAARTAVDKAIPAFSTDAARAAELNAAISNPDIAASNALSRLSSVRQQVGAGRLEVVQALDNYSTMTDALLAVDTSLVAGIGDDSIGSTQGALHNLLVVKEEMSSSEALLGYGISRGNLAAAQLNQLRTAEIRIADRLDDFRAAASPGQQQDFDRTVMGADYDTRARLASSVLNAQGASSGAALNAISGEQWAAATNAVISSLNTVIGRLGDQVTAASSTLVENSGTDAGLLAVLLFLALVITAAVVFLITRQLLSSLQRLRTSALDVADHQLPAAVQSIQEGQESNAEIQPLIIGTTDEIGEVAQAFDAVHSQALRLASEQAAMRTGFSSVFINLSRRSQSLVQRQLQLIERLERDEEDADQLSTLFQLDHLATRMRRNNENLMVLSGAEPGRRSGQPVSTADVLRAAVSEIEQYQRVVVQAPSNARIVGYAASDLMRLIAELLDNATAFSAPETQVTVTTRAESTGLLVDIVDKGIGMNEAEVAEANARLNEAASVDLATSRRMGLFVVGRLAGRHHIAVSLHGGKEIVGVRATVAVPRELVLDLPDLAPSRPEVETSAYQQQGGLPRRRTVNGAGRAGALTNLAGTAGTLGDGAATPGGWIQNGHSGVLPSRTSGEVEISGTALFRSARADDQGLPPAPPEPPLNRPQPELPADELPSGKALFAATNNDAEALTDWWNTAPVEPPQPPPPPLPKETTPIFDETLSAWFRSDRPAPARPSAQAPAAPPSKPQPLPKPEPEPVAQEEPEPVEAEEPAETGQYTETPDEIEAEHDEAAETEEASDAEEAAATERSAAGWDFAADESWRTVQSVSQAEPTSYTDAGLPRRQRGEQLMPGSALAPFSSSDSGADGADGADGAGDADGVGDAGAAPEAPHALPVRDPADVRGRLSSFQKGVYRARHAAKEQRSTAPQPPAMPQPAAEPVTSQFSQSWRPPVGFGQSPSPQSTPNPQPAPGRSQAPQPNQVPQSSQSLPQRRPKPVPPREAPPTSVPSGGQLPQRRPSSAESTGYSPTPAESTGYSPWPTENTGYSPVPAAGTGYSPVPAESTGYTSMSAESTGYLPVYGDSTAYTPSPERGISPQPERSAEIYPATSGEQPEPQQHWRHMPAAAAEPPAQLPAQPSQWTAEPASPQRQPEAPESVTGAAVSGGDSAWSFATDESWRTVQAVSQAAPSSFTAAGLPRRQRGEKLMPGAAASTAPSSGPRPARDPQDVRGRLSSFQQGVRRGRHRTAQTVDSERETMEGE